MAGTIQRVSGPTALTGGAVTQYTVPSGQKLVVRGIHASNGDPSTTYKLTVSIGADAAGTRIYDQFPIAPSQIEDNFQPFTLQAGEIIQAYADVGAKIVLVIDGELSVVP